VRDTGAPVENRLILLAYHIQPQLDNEALNALFATTWPHHEWRDFQPVLRHSLTYVTAQDRDALIGFVNVAWDGGIHAFLLDTTIHPRYQRQGIGRGLVRHAVAAAQAANIHWLHVDYEPRLERFYHACGFRPTRAGLIALSGSPVTPKS
jgi:GNAT superfamily N-acetyltransferase